MKEVIDTAGSWNIVEETLTDGSKVYNVAHKDPEQGIEIPCRDYQSACDVACFLKERAAV